MMKDEIKKELERVIKEYKDIENKHEKSNIDLIKYNILHGEKMAYENVLRIIEEYE